MKAMTFQQVLESEFYFLVEAIEHGSSDPKIENMLRAELLKNTGYKWID